MVRDSEWGQDGCCSGAWEGEAVEDFAVPRKDGWGTLVHLKLNSKHNITFKLERSHIRKTIIFRNYLIIPKC